MKNLLHRWRIARELDEGRPLPPATRRRLERDPALRRHRERLALLEQGLRSEARALRAARSSALPPEAVREALARAPRPAGARRRRRPALLLPAALSAAAALTLFLVATRGEGDDAEPAAGPGAVATSLEAPTTRASDEGLRAPRPPGAHGHAAGEAPLAPFRRIAAVTVEPPTRLFLAADRDLAAEARNVVRDARRLAEVVVARVDRVGLEALWHEADPN